MALSSLKAASEVMFESEVMEVYSGGWRATAEMGGMPAEEKEEGA